MTNKRRLIRTVFLAATSVCIVVPLGQAQNPVIRIGISIDGPWERNDEIRSTFEEEITRLLASGYDVLFPADKRLLGDWTASRIKENLDQLLADPEVDCVLALGVLSSNDVAYRGPLPKPVIAPFVLNPRIQGISYQLREERAPGTTVVQKSHVSGVTNLSYINTGADIGKEVRKFREIVPFSRLTILGIRALAEQIPALPDNMLRELAPLGLQVQFVPVGDSLKEALAQIPSDAQAVYVAPQLQLPPGEFDRLVKALIERRLPSFSLWGRSEVEKGLLASLTLEVKVDRLARRTALNLHRILMGEEAAEIPVDIEHDERLAINMATARAIGVYPSFALLTEAELLNQPRTQAARSLSLSNVIREASMVNLDLAEADRTVAAGMQLVREARSALLPQFDGSSLSTFIDTDRARASFGSQGQRQVAGSLTATQLIYSEGVKANYDIEQSLQNVRQEDRAQLRLEVVLEAAESYLNVLRAKTVERIQRDNLELTRKNLELAQARVELGAAGREEVFRWESQTATNRRDVIEANAQRNQAEIALNRVLNRPLEESFLTEEAGLDDPELATSFEQLGPYIDSPQTFGVFRKFMVVEAFEGSPELRQLDNAILAQERALLASKRAFYVPTLGVQADITTFKNGGAGSTPPELSPEIPFTFPVPGNVNWTVGISASLPLFQGGALRARRTRAEIELDELTVRREAVRQRVEQRIRSILHQTGASFVSIDLARQAAEAARRNFEVVQDAYSEGVVDIIRLLDAQNQALVEDLVAANAIFDYLLDLMGVQRAVGRFDYYRSDQDRQDLLNRLDAFFKEQGFEIRRP